eukprot:2437959-Rhodomonas_salina.1
MPAEKAKARRFLEPRTGFLTLEHSINSNVSASYMVFTLDNSTLSPDCRRTPGSDRTIRPTRSLRILLLVFSITRHPGMHTAGNCPMDIFNTITSHDIMPCNKLLYHKNKTKQRSAIPGYVTEVGNSRVRPGTNKGLPHR